MTRDGVSTTALELRRTSMTGSTTIMSATGEGEGFSTLPVDELQRGGDVVDEPFALATGGEASGHPAVVVSRAGRLAVQEREGERGPGLLNSREVVGVVAALATGLAGVFGVGVALARDKNIAPAVAQEIANTRPMTPIEPSALGYMLPGQRTVKTPGCKKAGPGEPFKVTVTYQPQAMLNGRSTTGTVGIRNEVRLSGANKSVPVTLTYEVPVAGGGRSIRETHTTRRLTPCIDNQVMVTFGYDIDRGSSTLPVSRIYESIKGPGLQRYRLSIKKNGKSIPVGTERRKHNISVVREAPTG